MASAARGPAPSGGRAADGPTASAPSGLTAGESGSAPLAERSGRSPDRTGNPSEGRLQEPPRKQLRDRPEEQLAERLKITEIFHSLQGEALFSGWPTVFIRLTGCPLRCQYCDTAYAFSGGEWRTIGDVLSQTRAFGARHVCVTGGEPLAQPRCNALIEALCDEGFEVCLETSGAMDIGAVDARCSRIVDIKTPGSKESDRNRWENLGLLTANDALKLVICDRADYEWARERLAEWSDLPCTVFLSPSYEELSAATLADWMLEDRLPVRLQLQLHKLLWGDVPGR